MKVLLALVTLICAACFGQGLSGELAGQCREDGSGESCEQESLRGGDAFVQTAVLAKKKKKILSAEVQMSKAAAPPPIPPPQQKGHVRIEAAAPPVTPPPQQTGAAAGGYGKGKCRGKDGGKDSGKDGGKGYYGKGIEILDTGTGAERFDGLVYQVGGKTGNMLIKSFKVQEKYGQEAMIPKMVNPSEAKLGDKISFEVQGCADDGRPLAINVEIRGHVEEKDRSEALKTLDTTHTQDLPKPKIELPQTFRAQASGLSEDEEHEHADGADADKELILDDFRTNLSACMHDMMANIPDEDSERSNDLQLIYEAEVLKKAHALGLIDEENIVWAAVLGAQAGAQRIARDQSRNALLDTFSKHNMTDAIRDKFLARLDELAHLCNDSSDADALVEDEKQLLSTNGGPLKAGEAQAAVELAEYVISKCSAEALDLEWFFAHAASISDNTSCGTLVYQEIKVNLGDQAVVHDAHIQTVLALHNEENQIGHDYAKHLKHVTDGIITHKEFAHTGAEKLRNALLSDLSKPTRAKLRYLENKHFAKLHGATKRELCAQRDQLKADKPDHFSLQSDTVYTKMYKCMCEDDEIFLVCQARYHEDVTEEQPHAFKRMQQAVQEEKEARHHIASEKTSDTSSVARANASWVDPSGGGLCKVPIQGCISIGEAASGRTSNMVKCCLPARADANVWGSTRCGNPFGIFAMIASASAAIEATIEFHYGWPAVECAFKLRIRIGVATSITGHWTDVMVNFNIFIAIDLCLGGTLGAIATALGWAACMNIGTLRYYPFIGKMTASLRLPLINLVVVSAWARLDVGGPIHDVTDAIKNVISNPDHNAFRSACPGCPGTSAAALVSYDESSDDTANIDDAANLGFWRRRRRDRRRRERRRDICLARPCNGGNAKEYWRRKMEDARGGLFLKITGEGCALWWCWDLVSFEWKWGTPAITLSGEGNRAATGGSANTVSAGSMTGGQTVAFKGGKDGRYCADESNTIKCNRNGIGPWEKFKLEGVGSQTAMRGGKDNRYCADESNTIKCNRNAIGPWEKFTLVQSGSNVALKGGKDNRYCADEHNTIKCNRGGIGQWEKFTVYDAR